MNRKLTRREKEVFKRCVIIFIAMVYCFVMAAVKARGADYFDGQSTHPWAYDDEDEFDVMSDDDHIMAYRMSKNIVGTRPIYNRRKASQPNDRVIITVNEDTSSKIEDKTDLSRDSKHDMSLTNWLTLGGKQRGNASGGATPRINYNTAREHTSDSKIERKQSFRSTLTGKVVYVQPNGYLIIEARKSVNVNGEEQTVTVTGIVNPDDMDSESKVNADRIIDMKVVYGGKGPMTRMDKRGWAAKAIDFLSPF